MKILNLYACLGGNRFLWNEVKNDIEVTAVELDQNLAELYQKRFPNDKVIVADAHKYLLKNFKNFDFIWTSPPCPTHSKVRISQKNTEIFVPKFPSMKLYEEIIFLKHYFNGKYIVENVIPYYEPLIPAQKRGRHLFWSNFLLPNNLNERQEGKGLICGQKANEYKKLLDFHNIHILNEYKGKQAKKQIARNLIDYELGKTILEVVLGIITKSKTNQLTLI